MKKAAARQKNINFHLNYVIIDFVAIKRVLLHSSNCFLYMDKILVAVKQAKQKITLLYAIIDDRCAYMRICVRIGTFKSTLNYLMLCV